MSIADLPSDDIWFDDMHDAKAQYMALRRLLYLEQRKVESLQRELKSRIQEQRCGMS